MIKEILKLLLPKRFIRKLADFYGYYFDGYAQKSYSQEGEDMILQRFFGKQNDGFYVDVGAHHPKRFSNTYLFYKKGWNGINVDAMDPYMPKEITWRKSKVGFNSPIVDWMQGDLKEWFLDTVHDKAFLESSLVDNPKLIQRKTLELANKQSNSYIDAERNWTKLTPYLWEKAILRRKYD